MIILKISTLFLLAFIVRAEKKIELHDIEEDNLKSEKEKEYENSEHRLQGGSATGSNLVPLDFLKNGFLRYFDSTPAPQPRYVQQYSVTEQPERQPVVSSKVLYDPPVQTQQAMVGYLSNMPMQIYLVPQYYNNAQDHAPSSQPGLQYSTPSTNLVAHYQNAPEAVQTQNNYIEVPAYVTPTAKTYVPQYTSQVASVSYSPQPTVAPPQPTIASVLTYQLPVVQYQNAIVQSPSASLSKEYYQNTQYTKTNAVEDVHEHANESPSIHTEVTYEKPPAQEYHRYYPSRTPQRDGYRHSTVSELPHPNPLILKSQPPHLSHLPKALPMYRPITKPVYTTGGIASGYTQRPHEPYGPPYKRRPTSLLDSYIPSHVQVEYMKRGFARDPMEAFEALSSGRHLVHQPVPRHYERGFLPNQMYHTPSGGITYAHYKRTPKVDNTHHN